MARGERTHYLRRHVCPYCGRITPFNPHFTLCNSCGGRLRAGIVRGVEKRVPRFWGLSHRWEADRDSEVFFRWEDDEMPAKTAEAP